MAIWFIYNPLILLVVLFLCRLPILIDDFILLYKHMLFEILTADGILLIL